MVGLECSWVWMIRLEWLWSVDITRGLENRERFGHERSHLSETVGHRCGICSLLILLSTASLRDHAKYHKISSREYNRKFITLIKPTKKGMRQRNVDEEIEEGEVVKER